MKKIIFVISFLIICVCAVTWLYFKNIGSAENNVEKAFKIIPSDASLIFEFKNETYFYDIFKDFSLFRDVLGNENLDHLNALKAVFVDDKNVSSVLTDQAFFFSLHPGNAGNAEVLMLAPLDNKDAEDKIISLSESLTSKYQIKKEKYHSSDIYILSFSNDAKFHFSFLKNTLTGSFNETLLKSVLDDKSPKSLPHLNFQEINSTRNRNSIAKLYINYPNLHQLLGNFSRRKDPEETAGLKLFPAFSTLNINYQSEAFMFSGFSEINSKDENYAALFLDQQPGKNTLANIIPYDAANYLLFFVSDQARFGQALTKLLKNRKEDTKKAKQLDNIATKHSINIEKEFPQVLGHEFGVVQLASGDKIGLIKSKNVNRLSFILTSISSAVTENIRRLDDSDLLYYYLGDPFKTFKRPCYSIIENHIVIANNSTALKRFLNHYENQDFLGRTEKNIMFQQYLSNQGNIFYFIHNGNAKGLIRSYLSSKTYKSYGGDNFKWKDIYGLSIQFSADKTKFFTNLFMNKTPEKEEINFHKDSLGLDTLLK